MAEKKRATCWMDWKEWTCVYEMLYCFDNKANQIKALKVVDVWRSRSSAKLPIAVECTACLVAADIGLGTGSNKTRGLSIAMGLVRFVNGMVDQVQKGLYARSVQSIAEEIGIPDWLVDIRHEATHAVLPSIEILEAGLGVALQWLKEKYWNATFEFISNSKQDWGKDTEMLLQEFISIQLSDLKAKEKRNLICSCQASLLKPLTSIDKIRKFFIPSLLKQGILFPTESQLMSLKDKDTDSAMLAFITLWMPLMKSLHENYKFFLSEFIQELVGKSTSEEMLQTPEKYTNMLVLEFLKGLRVRELDDILKDVLLRFCLGNPSKESLNILDYIQRKGFVNKHGLKRIAELVALASPIRKRVMHSMSEEMDFIPVKLEKQTRDYFDENPIIGIDMNELESNITSRANSFDTLESWKAIQGVDWTKIPTGKFLNDLTYLTNNETENMNLILPAEVDELYEAAVSQSFVQTSFEGSLDGEGESHVTNAAPIGQFGDIEFEESETRIYDGPKNNDFGYNMEDIQDLRNSVTIF